jgi:DNA modification methylase
MHLGDCREILPTLQECSVNTCVTSPPYWGLRDYGHENQIGQEIEPSEFIESMVGVFREVRRVLRDDGTLWLNLGDSYNAAGRSGHGTRIGYKQSTNRASASGQDDTRPTAKDLKPKDLVGIPWRVALALQADGWYLRQDIVWHKPNPMPESVRDRCTKSHEYIFLLSKSERYFFNSEGIKEPAVCGANGSEFHTGKTGEHQLGRAQKVRPSKPKGSFNGKTEAMADTGQNAFRAVTETRNKRSVWTVPLKPYKGAHFATYPQELIEPCVLAGCPEGGLVLDPFIGSGTTAAVAQKCGCKFVGCELNATYLDLAAKRFRQRGLPFDVA